MNSDGGAHEIYMRMWSSLVLGNFVAEMKGRAAARSHLFHLPISFSSDCNGAHH